MTDAPQFAEVATYEGAARLVEIAASTTRDASSSCAKRPATPSRAYGNCPPVENGEPPEQTAQRALRELSLTSSVDATYAGHFESDTHTGVTRQLVFTASVASTDVVLSPAHDDYTWRHADALPAVTTNLLDLVRRIAPPKPLLTADEWQHSLPRWHVGANALVRDQHGRILLVRPARSPRFQLPGGQVDAHETPQDAAGRELHEETGLDAPVGPLISISFEHPSPGWDHPTQVLLFDAGVVDSATVRLTALDPDIAEHRWAYLDDAETLLGPARTARLRAGLEGLQQRQPALIPRVVTSLAGPVRRLTLWERRMPPPPLKRQTRYHIPRR